MLQFATDRYNATQQAFPDPQPLKDCCSYVGLSHRFLPLCCQSWEWKPTYPAFEVYNIKKKKNLSYGKKSAA